MVAKQRWSDQPKCPQCDSVNVQTNCNHGSILRMPACNPRTATCRFYDLGPEKDRNIQLPPTSEIPWHSSQITMRFFRGRFFLEFNTEMLQKIGLSDHLSSLLCAALIAAMAIADSVLSYAAMQVAHATAVAGRLSATDSGRQCRRRVPEDWHNWQPRPRS